MDLTPSDEQRLLRESADRFIAETYTAKLREQNAKEPSGFSDKIWTQFAELGWLALPLPEAHGGIGGDFELQLEVAAPGDFHRIGQRLGQVGEQLGHLGAAIGVRRHRLRLQQRIEHVQQIGEAVVEGVNAAANGERLPRRGMGSGGSHEQGRQTVTIP